MEEKNENILDFTENEKEYFYDFLHSFFRAVDYRRMEKSLNKEEGSDENFLKFLLVSMFSFTAQRNGVAEALNIFYPTIMGATKELLENNNKYDDLFSEIESERKNVKIIADLFLGVDNSEKSDE